MEFGLKVATDCAGTNSLPGKLFHCARMGLAAGVKASYSNKVHNFQPASISQRLQVDNPRVP